MAKYFERDALIAQIRAFKCGEEEYDDGIETAVNVCAIADAADVKPVVRGKWEKRMKEEETPCYKSFTPIWSCSECGTEYDPFFCMTINFCPHCGADMIGGDAE